MSRWFAPLIRLAGADPTRVVALARGLHREARGQLVLHHQREGSRGLTPDAGRILVLIILALLSVAAAVGVGVLRDRPLLAAMLLVVLQGGAVFMRTAGEVAPLVLGSEDRRLLGWWPVSERELLLARGGLLLANVLEATAAGCAIPLVALLVSGRPPLLPFAGTLVALLLHAVTLAAVMLLLVQGLGRAVGRRRARRLVEVLGTTLLIIVLNVGVRALAPLAERLDDLSPWTLLAVPTTWYGSWGALARPSWPVVLGALLAVAATGALLAVGIRVLGRLDASEEEQPARGLRSGRDWTRPLLAWASPWLRGREGLAMRLLLKAHLREDWRFTSSIMLLPVALLVYLLVVRGHRLEELPGGLAGVGQAAGILGLWLSMLGLSLGGSASCSTEHQAAWLMGGGVLDGPRALSLQRRLVRCLVPGPMLVLATAGLVWRSGLDPLLAPLAMLPAWLGFEIMLTFVQWAAPSAPFSRAWRREGHGFRHYYLVLILVWPVAMVPVFLLYGRGAWGPPAVLALQALLLVGMRLALQRRVRGRGVYGLAPQTG